MKLIVGLGNPGEKFKDTRHNLGWQVIDRLANNLSQDFQVEDWKHELKFESQIAQVKDGDTVALLVKPLTFMNNSGRAVERIKNFFKLDQQVVVTVYDEVALDLGVIRTRRGGSASGHNGVASIIHHTGSDDFWRVRVGIGDGDDHRHDLTGFVLGKFRKFEQELLPEILDASSNLIVNSFISSEPEETTINVGD